MLFSFTPAVGKALSSYWCLGPCFALVLKLSGAFVLQHQSVRLVYVVYEALMVLSVFSHFHSHTVTLPLCHIYSSAYCPESQGSLE